MISFMTLTRLAGDWSLRSESPLLVDKRCYYESQFNIYNPTNLNATVVIADLVLIADYTTVTGRFQNGLYDK